MSKELQKQISERIEIAKEWQKVVKKEFEEYIQNKEFPLEERWSFFCRAPEFVTNVAPFIVHFDSLEGITQGDKYTSTLEEYLACPEHRHEEVAIENMWDGIQCILNDVKKDLPEDASKYQKEDMKRMKEFVASGLTQEVADNFREEVLAKNLSSFIYDW